MTTFEQKKDLETWFSNLRDRICQSLEVIEDEAHFLKIQNHTPTPGRFTQKTWERSNDDLSSQDNGGGTMAFMTGGSVFEKAGVNISTVYGSLSPQFAHEIPGTETSSQFWASGISLVIHPLNPFVPAVHMNTRHIITTKSWFGGGADLTPTFEYPEDTHHFHETFQKACDAHDPDYYPRFKKWCDDYFYLPHRKEPRGIGGIFYDYLNTGPTVPDFEKDFAFTRAVGEAFLEIYPALVRRHMEKVWTQEDKNKQLHKRGRYIEFNLLYDRGTRFGLKTGGNIDAILMSLPPLASWA